MWSSSTVQGRNLTIVSLVIELESADGTVLNLPSKAVDVKSPTKDRMRRLATELLMMRLSTATFTSPVTLWSPFRSGCSLSTTWITSP